MTFLKFLIRRLLAIPLTLFVITAVLFAFIVTAPPEERAALYFPPRQPRILTDVQIQAMLERIIVEADVHVGVAGIECGPVGEAVRLADLDQRIGHRAGRGGARPAAARRRQAVARRPARAGRRRGAG